MSLAALVAALVLASVAPAAAALYRWTDVEGVVHYTSELHTIPPARRATAEPVAHPGARPAPAARVAPAGAVIPFDAGGAVVVDAVLGGVQLRLLLDTGADRTVISPAALRQAGFDPAGGVGVSVIGVTGSAGAMLVTVPSLDLAGVRVGPLAVVTHPVPAAGIDGLLGRDVLDAFTVTMDPVARRATLVPR